MKKVFYFMMAVALLCGCADKPEEEKLGSIYGVITDDANELMRAASVQLNPIGLKTTTGNDGQYEFTDLKAGDYTLQVTKTGYTEMLGHKVKVEPGKTVKSDIQIKKLPAALKVVDSNAQEIDCLSFGSEISVVTRSFSIFNGFYPLFFLLTNIY